MSFEQLKERTIKEHELLKKKLEKTPEEQRLDEITKRNTKGNKKPYIPDNSNAVGRNKTTARIGDEDEDAWFPKALAKRKIEEKEEKPKKKCTFSPESKIGGKRHKSRKRKHKKRYQTRKK
jgi:hypothetical protein